MRQACECMQSTGRRESELQEADRKGHACVKRMQAGETKRGRKRSNGERRTSMGGGQQPHRGTSAA
eukprot:357620-Chlamydomonas_euryale.AAC.3